MISHANFTLLILGQTPSEQIVLSGNPQNINRLIVRSIAPEQQARQYKSVL